MPGLAVAEQHVERAIVDLPGHGLALVVADEVARIQRQLTCAQRCTAKQAEVMLTVDFVQLAVLVTEAQVWVEHIVHPAHAEVIGCGRATKASILVDQAHGLTV
ncbi:hypothetical protein D3C76_1109290 [compost metagenome]